MALARRAPRYRKVAERGFTLVELMAVVVMVGVLALLATYGVRKYIASSKTSEAIEMIGSIKSAEENYKDETFKYLDVTGGVESFYPPNPSPGQVKVPWGAPDASLAKWQTLGVNAAGPVLFVYACTAGSSADSVPIPLGITIGNWPNTQTGPWYVVKAKADLDASGTNTVFVSASFTGEIFSANN